MMSAATDMRYSYENRPLPTHRRGNPCGCPSLIPRHHQPSFPRKACPVLRHGNVTPYHDTGRESIPRLYSHTASSDPIGIMPIPWNCAPYALLSTFFFLTPAHSDNRPPPRLPSRALREAWLSGARCPRTVPVATSAPLAPTASGTPPSPSSCSATPECRCH